MTVTIAWRSALRKRIEEELVDLNPAERARSVAWILDADGNSDRFSLQLPFRGDKVVEDTKPFVSPLVDIADRGAPTGVILAGGDLARLVQIEQAEATEPENSSYELSLGDWRPFGGSAGGSPVRGLQTVSHQERYRARVEAQREQLFETAATQTAKRLEALRWERIVLVSERQVASRFREALPAVVTERVIAEADLNLVGEEPTAIADAIEPLIEDGWLKRTTALIELAHERAQAGGAATIGAQETLGCARRRPGRSPRSRPDHDFSSVAGMIPPSIEGPSDMAGRASGRSGDRHVGAGNRAHDHRVGDALRRRWHGRAVAVLRLPKNLTQPSVALEASARDAVAFSQHERHAARFGCGRVAHPFRASGPSRRGATDGRHKRSRLDHPAARRAISQTPNLWPDISYGRFNHPVNVA